MRETKGAPAGFHFTKDGKLKRGDADQDGKGGPMLRADPLDKQRSKVPPVSEAKKTLTFKQLKHALASAKAQAKPKSQVSLKKAPFDIPKESVGEAMGHISAIQAMIAKEREEKKKREAKKESAGLDEKGPAIKQDNIKVIRTADKAHSAAMGRTPAGRKKPTKAPVVEAKVGPSHDEIMKAIGNTQSSAQGMAILQKKFKLTAAQARKHMDMFLKDDVQIDEMGAFMSSPLPTPMSMRKDPSMTRPLMLTKRMNTAAALIKKAGNTPKLPTNEAVDSKKFDVYKKHMKTHNLDEPTVRMAHDNPDHGESKRMMKNPKYSKGLELYKASMKEATHSDSGWQKPDTSQTAKPENRAKKLAKAGMKSFKNFKADSKPDMKKESVELDEAMSNNIMGHEGGYRQHKSAAKDARADGKKQAASSHERAAMSHEHAAKNLKDGKHEVALHHSKDAARHAMLAVKHGGEKTGSHEVHKDHSKAYTDFTGRKNESVELDEAKLSQQQRNRLDDLIFNVMITGNIEYDGKDNPTRHLKTIEKEFGPKVAKQVEAGMDIKNWGRDNHSSGFLDSLAYRKKSRISASGKMNKQDAVALGKRIMQDKSFGGLTKKVKLPEEAQIDEKTGVFGGDYTSKDHMMGMKNFMSIRDKKAKQRDAEHQAQDPKMAKMGYAKHMMDMDKAKSKAAKKGVNPSKTSRSDYETRNGMNPNRKLPEDAQIDEISMGKMAAYADKAVKSRNDAKARTHSADSNRRADAEKTLVKRRAGADNYNKKMWGYSNVAPTKK
jgi:hypothetical protein